MPYNLDPNRDSCYPGTSVLMNKFNIRVQEQLNETEEIVVGVQTFQFEQSPFPEQLDFSYYKRLHQFLFGQLYSWAGTVRTVDLRKQHTRFCPSDEIESLAEAMFSRLASMHYFCGLPRHSFLKELTDFYASLNYLHPFREGNGRTQRVYFRQLAIRAGYHLDFSAIDGDLMMLATIHAASGVQDTLLQVFDTILTESQ